MAHTLSQIALPCATGMFVDSLSSIIQFSRCLYDSISFCSRALMASGDGSEPASMESVPNPAMVSVGEGDPPSSSFSSSSASSSSSVSAAAGENTDRNTASAGAYRLFNRQRPIHQVLGGGKSADVMLWREKYIPAAVLAAATVAWLLFKHSGYTLLSITSNMLLLLILGLFAWANVAVLVHRDPPRIPELQVSEEMVVSFASALRVEINKALEVAHDIALGKDLILFLKVVTVLWGLSLVGGWFHFLTLIYMGIVLLHTAPVIYERYEQQIDSNAKVALDKVNKHFRAIGDVFVRNFSKATPGKKSQ